MSILFFFFLSINGVFSIPSFGENLPNTMQFELIHKHAAEFSGPKTRLERVKELVQSDNLRAQMILQRVNQRRKTTEIANRSCSAAIPISSGAYTGIGEYFVEFRVGTPSQKFLLVADTGSDLTWMKCRYERRIRRQRIFHTHRSSSFKKIPCSTEMCKTLPFSLDQCPKPMTPCAYDYRYTDGSAAHGYFANETVTVCLTNGRKKKLQQVVVGCSSSFMGPTFRASDGVLGLGYSKYSFAVRAMETFGGKFSYCLVDHLSPSNVSNYLTFGGSKSSASAKIQYTQLILDGNGFYAVNVIGISIGGVMLKIPSSTWDLGGNGGVIIDSGTSLALLAEPAYRVVTTALELPLMRFKKVEVKPFEFCFNSIGFDETSVPKLALHFADSTRFEPPVKSYVIDVSDGVKCLGFISNGWPAVSIIGNIMQQNFLWEFDISRKKLGFRPSTCIQS